MPRPLSTHEWKGGNACRETRSGNVLPLARLVHGSFDHTISGGGAVGVETGPRCRADRDVTNCCVRNGAGARIGLLPLAPVSVASSR